MASGPIGREGKGHAQGEGPTRGGDRRRRRRVGIYIGAWKSFEKSVCEEELFAGDNGVLDKPVRVRRESFLCEERRVFLDKP